MIYNIWPLANGDLAGQSYRDSRRPECQWDARNSGSDIPLCPCSRTSKPRLSARRCARLADSSAPTRLPLRICPRRRSFLRVANYAANRRCLVQHYGVGRDLCGKHEGPPTMDAWRRFRASVVRTTWLPDSRGVGDRRRWKSCNCHGGRSQWSRTWRRSCRGSRWAGATCTSFQRAPCR